MYPLLITMVETLSAALSSFGWLIDKSCTSCLYSLLNAREKMEARQKAEMSHLLEHSSLFLSVSRNRWSKFRRIFLKTVKHFCQIFSTEVGYRENNIPGHYIHMNTWKFAESTQNLRCSVTRKSKEQRLIFKVVTLAPHGINEWIQFA